MEAGFKTAISILENAIFVLNWQLNQQLATQKLSCQLLSIRLLISNQQMNRPLAVGGDIFIVKQCKCYFKSKFSLLEQYILCFKSATNSATAAQLTVADSDFVLKSVNVLATHLKIAFLFIQEQCKLCF